MNSDTGNKGLFIWKKMLGGRKNASVKKIYYFVGKEGHGIEEIFTIL